jgi:hypothetical protein
MIAHTMLIKCYFCEIVRNILNVQKYCHLSENLTFIGHFCEIISLMCSALCFVSDGNY